MSFLDSIAMVQKPCSIVLKVLQWSIAEGGNLERDLSTEFPTYKSDLIVTRLARTASDVFGPVWDHLGARDLWEAHCAENGVKSTIRNCWDNRFNGLFEVSSQVIHHQNDFIAILDAVKTPNKKLKAVSYDLKDRLAITVVQALGIMYYEITGHWNMICIGKVRYLELYKVI